MPDDVTPFTSVLLPAVTGANSSDPPLAERVPPASPRVIASDCTEILLPLATASVPPATASPKVMPPSAVSLIRRLAAAPVVSILPLTVSATLSVNWKSPPSVLNAPIWVTWLAVPARTTLPFASALLISRAALITPAPGWTMSAAPETRSTVPADAPTVPPRLIPVTPVAVGSDATNFTLPVEVGWTVPAIVMAGARAELWALSRIVTLSAWTVAPLATVKATPLETARVPDETAMLPRPAIWLPDCCSVTLPATPTEVITSAA